MIYKIKSVHFFDTDSIYVSADYSNVVMQYLISYIQFKFYKFAPDYGLSPRQIGSILTNVYGFNDTEPNDESLIIDTFNQYMGRLLYGIGYYPQYPYVSECKAAR